MSHPDAQHTPPLRVMGLHSLIEAKNKPEQWEMVEETFKVI